MDYDYDVLRALLMRDTKYFLSLQAGFPGTESEIDSIVKVNNKLADILEEEGLFVRAQSALCSDDINLVTFALTDLFYRGLRCGQMLPLTESIPAD